MFKIGHLVSLVHIVLELNEIGLVISTQSTQCNILSKVTKVGKFNLIGLFPIRIQYPQELYANGILRAEVMKYVIMDYNKKYRHNLIGYTLYDVCGSFEFEMTTAAAMDVALSNPYVYLTDSQRNTCPCTYKNKPLLQTLGIVGPASSSKSIHISNLLQHEELPIISYASTSPELSNRQLYPTFFRTIQSDIHQAKFVKTLLKSFNWTYVSMIAADDSYGRSGMKELKADQTLCYLMSETLSSPVRNSSIHKIMMKLKEDEISNVVILWGSRDLIISILKYATLYKIHGKVWILSEASGRNMWFLSNENKLNGTIILVVSSSGRYHEFERYIFNMKYNDTKDNPWLRTFFQTKGINETHNNHITLEKFKSSFEVNIFGFVRNAVVTYIEAFTKYLQDSTPCNIEEDNCYPPPITNHKDFINRYIKATNFKGLLNETVDFNENGDVTSQTFQIYIAKRNNKTFQLLASWRDGNLTKYPTDDPGIIKTKSACSESCTPGFYHFGKRICCWKCVKCRENYINPKHSQNSCSKCPSNYISNENRTQCVLLLQSRIEYESGKAIAIYVVSSIGIILTLFIMTTFIISRKTPVVRSANLIPSIIQLLAHLLLFVVQYLYLDKESLFKCRTRTFATGILFSFVVGITLTKVTHIVTVFKLKYVLNKREVFKLMTIECLMIIVAVLINVCLTIVFMQINKIRIEKTIDRPNRTQHNVCTIRLHSVGQTIYILFLQIFCAIQAFRGRKLPASYNETRYIAFAMFSSSLIQVAGIAINEGMNNAMNIKFGMAMITMSANIAILTTLYGYKIRIIWFYPDENNEQAFNRERIKSFSSLYDRRWSQLSIYSTSAIDFNSMAINNVISNAHRASNASALNTPQLNRFTILENPSALKTEVHRKQSSMANGISSVFVIQNDHVEDNMITPVKSSYPVETDETSIKSRFELEREDITTYKKKRRAKYIVSVL